MLVARAGGMTCLAALADVEVGTELPAQTFPVTRAHLVRYAGASGDFNPIHWNERFAREVGLPDVIAHGMLTMAVPSASSPTGPATRARSSSTGAVHPAGRRPRRRRRCRADRPRPGRARSARTVGSAST